MLVLWHVAGGLLDKKLLSKHDVLEWFFCHDKVEEQAVSAACGYIVNIFQHHHESLITCCKFYIVSSQNFYKHKGL